jgi:gamma-glutamyltranspeptidase/glutathione hydrolase
MRFLHPALLLIVIFIFSCQNQPQKQLAERVYGPIGDSVMVSTAHPLATEAGLRILKKGGNAYDAAVAIHFALAVVFPEAGNIGGGGFAVYRTSDGEIGSLDYREKAPAASTRDMYLDENGDVIDMKSRFGHQAAGVPGSVAGMWALHQRLGSLQWSDLLQPAIELAFNGYILSEYSAANLNEKQEDFKDANRRSPWTVKDQWQTGDTIIQQELASTLAMIQSQGRDGFYKGIVADQIEKEMLLGNGLITKADLANYEAKWREPVQGAYRNYNIVSMPPPSSGGVAILQLLKGAEQFDLHKLEHNSTDYVHLITEMERRVYADRATHLGDPDFYDVPVDMLLSEEYNKERYSTISKRKKTPSTEIKEGEVEVIESVQTTHYSVVDKEGNALSGTTTLNAFYCCKVMVQGAGFFLNNEMNDFSSKPGVPNMFGLVGAEANAIAPGKRMLSSMTPTIVEKDGELFMVVGTPGGATIITSVFQAIMNVTAHDMTMQEAVNAPRFHHQWLPDRILLEENRFDASVIEELKAMDHELEFRPNWGRVDAVLVLSDSTLEGAADYLRGDDYAAGY